MSFRSFLNELKKEDNLEKIKDEVSPKFEIASKLKKSEKPLLFEKVREHRLRVAGNIYSSRKEIAEALGTEKNRLIDRLRSALSEKREPSITKNAPAQEIEEDEVNLKNLPILKHFKEDGGPYVTSSILVAKNAEGIRNISFHRMQLMGRNKFAVRLVPRNLHKMFEESEKNGESPEVAAVLGSDISTALAAATSLPYEADEFELAGALSENLELTKCKSVDLEVPADTEIVMEGRLLAGERAPEGPFADITGTYDAVRQQPVFKVEEITRREDAIYQAILPGSKEHQLLMGMPREPLIFEEVDKVAKAKNIVLTPGGCGWLHAFVSIEKQEETDGPNAIEAAFEAHPSIKHVVIVDEDIDIYNPKMVEWAIATRFRADRDAVIKSGVQGSSLDPTADPETRLGSKMGIDATKGTEDSERFERAQIPE